MDWRHLEQSGRKSLQIICGTPLDLNLVLEQTKMYTSNCKMMNMETNIIVTSLYTWTMYCVLKKIPTNT